MGFVKAFAAELSYSSGSEKAFTLGYADPDRGIDGRLTAASDVYSFGLVILVVFTSSGNHADAWNCAQSALKDDEYLYIVA